MKRGNRLIQTVRYLLASVVIVIGLVTLLATVRITGEGGVGPVHAAFTADPTRGLMPLEVFFDASASSGEIAVYAWNFGDGRNGSGIMPTHTYINPGTYTVSLRVESPRDPFGGAHYDYAYLDITVEGSINAAFTAQPTSGPPPLEVLFDASASSSQDGTIISYEWDFGDGQSGEGVTTTHTYTSSGRYEARLIVTEDIGARHSVVQNIRVGIPTAAFTALPRTGQPPLEVTFDASDSFYEYGSIVAYEWGFGDGESGQGVTTTHIYTSPGTYGAWLTVTNDVGGTDRTVHIINVETGIPTAVFTAQPASGPVPLEVFFDASASSDPDDTIVVYEWEFGDGVYQASSNTTITHTYTVPGTYTVTLVVQDSGGNWGEATQVVTVEVE